MKHSFMRIARGLAPKLTFGAFALSAMLAACGDDSTSAKDADQPDVVVETFDDLPVCSDNQDGSTAYVKDEKTAYVCVDGDWVPEEENSSSSIASSSSSPRNDSLSSSVIASSSSETTQSSSSEATQSSSSEAMQSSSSEAPQSSSSETMQSSSSEAPQSSSSEAMQSSSSEATQSSSSEAPQSSSSADVNSSSSENELSSSSEMGIIYGTMTDSRDGNTYKTVKIGEQVWMAENLNYADSVKTPSLKENSWCYGNVAANCEKYGRLYTWAAAIDSVKLANDVMNPLDCGYGKTCDFSGTVQGICPSGWHLPSRDEWNTLITAVGGDSKAGTALKSTSGWTSLNGVSGNGTDAFGFSALPAGYRDRHGHYYSERSYAEFWTSTEDAEDGSYNAYDMSIFVETYASLNVSSSKPYGYSVRCLKD